jgi:hypothetical protein
VTALLVVISVLLAVLGAASLSQATMGVGVICLGVAFGVWARINQAAEHRREDKKLAQNATRPVQAVGASD